MNTSAISAISHHQWFWGPLWQAVNQGWLLTIHITNITKITLITSVFCRQWIKDGIDFAHYHHFQDYLDYQCFWQAVKQGWHWLCTLPSFPRLPWLPVFLADSESRMTIHITNISFIAWSSRCFFWRKNPLVTKITFITLITCFCQGIFSQMSWLPHYQHYQHYQITFLPKPWILCPRTGHTYSFNSEEAVSLWYRGCFPLWPTTPS